MRSFHKSRGRLTETNSKIPKKSFGYELPYAKSKAVHFHPNPSVLTMTELGRFIQNGKYSNALQWLNKFPKEASSWVSIVATPSNDENRQNNGQSLPWNDLVQRGDYTNGATCTTNSRNLQVLPIHIAIDHLRDKLNMSDEERLDLENLVASLVAIHPGGCSKRDPTGQLPLHGALVRPASLVTITALLCAAPDTILQADWSVTPHQTAIETVRHRLGLVSTLSKQQEVDRHIHSLQTIHTLLSRGVGFWKLASNEAKLRMKHRRIPAEDTSITSTSVLAASQCTRNKNNNNGDDASSWGTRTSIFFMARTFQQNAKAASSDCQNYPLLKCRIKDSVSSSSTPKENDISVVNDEDSLSVIQHQTFDDKTVERLERKFEQQIANLTSRVTVLEADRKSLLNQISKLEKLFHAAIQPSVKSKSYHSSCITGASMLNLPPRPPNLYVARDMLINRDRDSSSSDNDSNTSTHDDEPPQACLKTSASLLIRDSFSNAKPFLGEIVACNDVTTDMDNAIQRAEQMAGQKLRLELVKAWQTVSIQEWSDSSCTHDNETDPFSVVSELDSPGDCLAMAPLGVGLDDTGSYLNSESNSIDAE